MEKKHSQEPAGTEEKSGYEAPEVQHGGNLKKITRMAS